MHNVMSNIVGVDHQAGSVNAFSVLGGRCSLTHTMTL